MILGLELQPSYIILGGLTILLLATLTVLVGLRIIKFKGKMHLKVHKTLALLVIIGAAFHGTLAIVYLQGWKVLS